MKNYVLRGTGDNSGFKARFSSKFILDTYGIDADNLPITSLESELGDEVGEVMVVNIFDAPDENMLLG
jgi:hypothetical protein